MNDVCLAWAFDPNNRPHNYPKQEDSHSTHCAKMSFQQPHPDAPCLRFPENIGLHANVTIEAAANMLARATQLSLTVPYPWTFIDKPVGMSARDRTRTKCADMSVSISEGQVLLLFLPNPAQFPNDGIRYQDQETRYALPAPGNRVRIWPLQTIPTYWR